MSLNKKNFFLDIFNKNNPYINDLIVLCSSCFGLLYSLSLYFFNPADPSYISISYPINNIQNPIGLFGAWISSFAFYLLGLGAWVVLLPIVFLTLSKYHKDFKNFTLSRLLFLCTATLVFSSFLLSYCWETIHINETLFLGGGLLGKYSNTILS